MQINENLTCMTKQKEIKKMNATYLKGSIDACNGLGRGRGCSAGHRHWFGGDYINDHTIRFDIGFAGRRKVFDLGRHVFLRQSSVCYYVYGR